MKKAKEKLCEDKIRKNFNCKLNPTDRSSLQNMFSVNENIEDSTKFPGSLNNVYLLLILIPLI